MTGAEAYLHAKFHLEPSNRLATIHQRHRQTDRQTGQTDRHSTNDRPITAHRRRRRTVESYSPGCPNVPFHVGTLTLPAEFYSTCASFGPPESTTETANRSVQPFLHSSRQKVSILYNGQPFPPKLPLLMRDLDPS